MASEEFELVAVIPARPEAVYRAWLDGKEHGRMTGGPAMGEPVVGAKHSAWDGYIVGRNLELEPGARIVQSWRSTDFPESAPDSRLEVLLAEDGAGTRLVLRHSVIPEGQGKNYREGWVEHYFQPMQKYFGKPKPKKAKRRATSSARKVTKKRAAAKKAPTARGGARKKPASRPRRR